MCGQDDINSRTPSEPEETRPNCGSSVRWVLVSRLSHVAETACWKCEDQTERSECEEKHALHKYNDLAVGNIDKQIAVVRRVVRTRILQSRDFLGKLI